MPRNQSDTARLAALYDAHAARIWRYVVYLTGDHVGADDVVQETLLRAWRTPKILADDPDDVRSWMYTVARNIVIDDARSARRRRELSVSEFPESAARDSTDAVFDAILVEDALLALSKAHRDVVVCAYYRRLTVAEIAEDLGIPEGTVKSRLHYGLRALRLSLQEKGVTR
jgi:RNA polymerase sigma-70 factor, ECF subfamily